MDREFIRLRKKGDVHPMKWECAVNIAQIVSIVPVFAEANTDPTAVKTEDEAKGVVFTRAFPKDSADVTSGDLWQRFEVTDSLGTVYLSSMGPGSEANKILTQLYEEAPD